MYTELELHRDHMDLMEQLVEFGIESYIVGQKLEGGAKTFRVAEVEHVSGVSSATIRERDKLEFPRWMTLRNGARYMIIGFMYDSDDMLTRSYVREITIFSDDNPEVDALHAAYIPLDIPLDGLKIEGIATPQSQLELTKF